MKKLRMIVTSVVVLAIVGSAFAFKAKVGSFCIVTSDAANTVNCTQVIHNVRTTSTAPALGNGVKKYYYFQNFDGDPACTTTSGLCTATVNLKID